MNVNAEEIERQCARVAKMPPPRGWTRDQLLDSYAQSLSGFRADVVGRVVERFLTGGYERREINPDFAPSPPALAVLVRAASPAEGSKEAHGQSYSMARPASQVLEDGIDRDDAKRLIDEGFYPRGCIWLPGDYEAPRFGTLFAPDPDWKGAKRIPTHQEVRAQLEAEAQAAWQTLNGTRRFGHNAARAASAVQRASNPMPGAK